jgi:hypothetical protein
MKKRLETAGQLLIYVAMLAAYQGVVRWIQPPPPAPLEPKPWLRTIGELPTHPKLTPLGLPSGTPTFSGWPVSGSGPVSTTGVRPFGAEWSRPLDLSQPLKLRLGTPTVSDGLLPAEARLTTTVGERSFGSGVRFFDRGWPQSTAVPSPVSTSAN